jgi:plasmid stabilization system protein ParE
MAKKSIVWTETAVRQRREILKYWTVRNGSTRYAEKLIRIIYQRIQIILENEFAGKSTNHNDTREAAMGNFSIFYRIELNKIIIMAFWDNRQNPDKLLEILNQK